MNKKKFFSISNCLLLLMLGVASPTLNAQKQIAEGKIPLTPWQVASMIPRGINLSNTLERAPSWGGITTATEANFIAFKVAGFQSVRIPVRYESQRLVDGTTIKKEFIDKIERHVDWAIKHGLVVIINTHHEDWLTGTAPEPAGPGLKNPIDADPADIVKFVKLWENIAEHFKDKSDRLLFEIMNEPFPMSLKSVNEINRKVLQVIRKKNPKRCVLFSGHEWTSAAAFVQADVPNDDYVIGTFHSYGPARFGISGIGIYDKDVTDYVDTYFEAVKGWINKHKKPVILGEFGATEGVGKEKAFMVERRKYYKYVVEKAIFNNIPFCAWNSSVIDLQTNMWTELKDIIINTSGSANWNRKIEAESFSSQNDVTIQGPVGAKYVGYIDNNDYMVYANPNQNIIIPATGRYTVEYRVSCPVGGGLINLVEPGANGTVYAAISIPNTASYNDWITIKHNVNLTKGAKTFRINAVRGNFNLDWFKITQIDNGNDVLPSSRIGKPVDEQTPSLDIKSFLHDDILTVQLTGELSDVSLYSIDGKQLTTFSTKEVQKDIDMSKYTAGVYILKVSTAESILTTKVIKK